MKTLEFTGSPKVAGFKTKADFLSFIEAYGYKHTKLIYGTDFLVCNDYESTTAKMTKANKLGVQIITYSDFIKQINKHLNIEAF